MRRKNFIGVLIFFLVLSISDGYGQKDTLDVLFLGNSYTYFWNMPQTVEAISKVQKGTYIRARQSTAGGATWKEHWDGEKSLQSRKLIEENEWDIVILQNHSKSTIDNLDQFMDYGNRFIALAKKRGAVPILYQTWAREYNPVAQPTITNGYDELAQKNGIAVIPAGEIWMKVRKERPDLNLYDPDGSHPSTIGVYLTACIFYAYLLDQKTAGIPQRLRTIDANDETFYLSIMSPENAEFLQAVIDTYRMGGGK